MNKQEKGQAIEGLKEEFAKAKGAVITHYQGMTVAELYELRKDLSGLGVRFKVVKNTLARIASDGTPVGVAKDHFSGPVGIAIGYDDPVKVAQGIVKYSAKNEKLKPIAAVVEGQLVDVAELKSIASLPARPVLLSMMAGAFSAPMSKMAGALQATVSSFGYAMNALLAKKEQSGS
ncbi:MAG: 50S ribosomal protein L10 [Actinomycetota bacterium]|nr:50S ribosomal protein L10 [Actinomycetota bacterium]MDA8175202.1 50S ribosomal protein L10 [Nitrospiraceae bacterium]